MGPPARTSPPAQHCWIAGPLKGLASLPMLAPAQRILGFAPTYPDCPSLLRSPRVSSEQSTAVFARGQTVQQRRQQ
ncbi:hypothetical protein VFPFJ_02372 [Purpureocillium lilacinum]|uniref:Uncharacterized protein n=1 Tax=Purpureocillium lilacinum TaxID=33203 RepID=A0A179GMA9_PURLI|nr:hypothetical protein VFPFJ_02372 [Purpureocillium lilacinum]OAQ79035.1 hypothetical protein VFPBJ_07156 [Purpureocillium lilacinum]OAQ93211.1 hypothetical protein VFPFJ_02372 [Purpureocillium lilacinum]